MEQQIEQLKEKELNFEDNMFIAISSDVLWLMQNVNDCNKLLIDGNDNKALIVKGNKETITWMIHKCMDARETKTEVIFNIDNHTIKFK